MQAPIEESLPDIPPWDAACNTVSAVNARVSNTLLRIHVVEIERSLVWKRRNRKC